MRSSRFFTALVVVGMATTGLVQADWTASGTFTYVDREYDGNGFTGLQPQLPIRHATVEIFDADAHGKRAMLATGSTDDNGNFSIAVSDTKIRTVYIRVLSSSVAVGDLHLQVENYGSQAVPYAVASPEYSGHGPSDPLDIGTISAAIGAGAEAFNIYDMGVRSIDFIASLEGSRPSASDELRIEWDPVYSATGFSAYVYASKTIELAQISAFNDTVILHETGHYAYHLSSANDSPGGVHHLSDCDQDLRLAYDEGRATWFGQSILRHHGLSNPHLYVKTTGAPGPGNLDFYFDVESASPFYCDGAASEVAVYTALWDVNDSIETLDGIPGDDDATSLPESLNWSVDKNYIPFAANKSLEDFWDGWFSLGNGSASGMTATFQGTNAEFYPDAGEPNDSSGSAFSISSSGGVTHLTFFSDPDGDGVGAVDADYFSFAASAGSQYTIETLNLWGDANTSLELLDSDGSTVLASNDDRSAGDASSLIVYTPSTSGTLYVRSQHAPDLGIYGSYDLKVSGSAPVDSDGDGYLSDIDCDDTDPSVHPGATEICNGVDDNCVGGVDEGFDGDGDGYAPCVDDCDDTNPSVHPGATEICNGVDDNCVNGIDEGFDSDDDGYRTCDGDCDDTDPSVHPGAIEVCNGVDDNCVDGVDEGFDTDGDGYTTCGGDCEDSNPNINPGEAENCSNGTDDDCDGKTDDQDPECQLDTVTITLADWHPNSKWLTVRATSTGAPDATLTLVGFGAMSYSTAAGYYEYRQKAPSSPGSVTVTSSLGGSDSTTVN